MSPPCMYSVGNCLGKTRLPFVPEDLDSPLLAISDYGLRVGRLVFLNTIQSTSRYAGIWGSWSFLK